MKRPKFTLCRILALLLIAIPVSGCKIWNPATWTFKPKPKAAQRWNYEMATPYAALQPQPGDRLIAVSGMGYESSVAFFTADGRRVVSESAPAEDRGWGDVAQDGPLASLDRQGREERFGQSFAEKRLPAGTEAGAGDRGSSPVAPPDPFAGLPSAIPVPGKQGFVTLPDPYADLPQIDVRGIASGTPVEVPNPLIPGQKVRFRVP